MFMKKKRYFKELETKSNLKNEEKNVSKKT